MEVKGIFNRAIWVYVLLAIFFRVSVDFPRAAQECSHYLLGIFYNGSYKNYYDGIVYFDHQRFLNPKQAVNFANLGTCYDRLGRFKEARHYYEQALNLDPENALFKRKAQDGR